MAGVELPITAKISEVKLEQGALQKLQDVAVDMRRQLLSEVAAPPSNPATVGNSRENTSPVITGAVGGATAAGIFLLVDAIRDMTKQSKIVSMTQDAVAKATGLLVDMILIPFIPLLTYGIINLFRAVTTFGAEWKKDWKGEVAEIIIDSIINIFNPFVHVLEVLTGFDITDYFHHMLLSNEAWNTFVTAWDDFMKDPLAALKTAFSNFVGDAGTYFQNGLKAILNWLLEQPIIGDVLKGLGLENQMMRKTPSQIAQDLELNEGDYREIYANRKPTVTAEVTGETRMVSEVKVQIMVDGKWIDETIESKYNQMSWDQRAANWGTM